MSGYQTKIIPRFEFPCLHFRDPYLKPKRSNIGTDFERAYDFMPRAKMMDDPAVASYVTNQVTKARKATIAAAVGAAKAAGASHLEVHATDKNILRAIKGHSSDVLGAIRGLT